MSDEAWSIILAALAAVVALWVCWPHLLVGLGVIRFHNGTVGGPLALDPTDKDDEYRDRYFELVDLGFLPLGIHWARNGQTDSTAAYVFGFPGQPWMATLSLGSLTTSLVTAFRDDIFLQTLDHEIRFWQGSGFRLQGVPDQPMRDVLATHQKAVEALIGQGHEPMPEATLEDYAAIARAINLHPASQRWLRSRSLRYVATLLIGFLFCGALSGVMFRFDNPSTWLGLIAFGLWMKWQWQSSLMEIPQVDEAGRLV